MELEIIEQNGAMGKISIIMHKPSSGMRSTTSPLKVPRPIVIAATLM